MRRAHIGRGTSGRRGLLVVSYYAESLKYALQVARLAEDELGLESKFLITGPRDLAVEAAELISGKTVWLLQEYESSLRPVQTRNPVLSALRTYANYVSLASHFLRESDAAAILCTEDALGGVLLRVAKRRGIPSVYFQWTEIHSREVHEQWRKAERAAVQSQLPWWRRAARRGARSAWGAIWKLLTGRRPGWPFDVQATQIAVMGKFYRDMCIRGGVDPTRIVVTGNPQCDEMVRCRRLPSTEISRIRRKITGSPNTPYVLYAREHVARIRHLSTASAERAERMTLNALREAAPSLPIVVRLHPKEGTAEAERIRKIDPQAILTKKEVSVGEAIAASCLVVSTVSSSLLWAVGIDRPAISAFFWEAVDDFRLRRHWDGVVKVDDCEQLRRVVFRFLNDSDFQREWHERRTNCAKKFLVLDGRSTERIVDSLRKLINGVN